MLFIITMNLQCFLVTLVLFGNPDRAAVQLSRDGKWISWFYTSVSVGAMGRASYDMYVNWITEGAVCGMVGPECP